MLTNEASDVDCMHAFISVYKWHIILWDGRNPLFISLIPTSVIYTKHERECCHSCLPTRPLRGYLRLPDTEGELTWRLLGVPEDSRYRRSISTVQESNIQLLWQGEIKRFSLRLIITTGDSYYRYVIHTDKH